MKTLVLFLLITVVACADVDLTKPVPMIKLPDGRILRNVTFTKFGPLVVLTKSGLGVLGLRYEAFPDDVRDGLEKQRPGGPKWQAAVAATTSRKIEGQVFVTTRGSEAYRFTGATIKVYALTSWETLCANQTWKLPGNYRRMELDEKKIAEANAWYDSLEQLTPVGKTTTDADGNYSISVPAGSEYFVLCTAGREIGNSREQNTWALKIAEGATRLDLNNLNIWKQSE